MENKLTHYAGIVRLASLVLLAGILFFTGSNLTVGQALKDVEGAKRAETAESINKTLSAVSAFSALSASSALFAPSAFSASPTSPQAVTWPRLELVSYVTGLDRPTFLANAGDGSGRLFITEKPGYVRLVKDDVLQATPFLSITDRVDSGGSERGLLCIAFPPGYSTKGYFYVTYTNLDDNWVLSRFFLTADPDVADPASEQVVLLIPHPDSLIHYGGQLAFGPTNGYLYVSVGDGGPPDDIYHHAQDPALLLGKLLRLDVETGSPLTYTVPASNPFTQTVGYRPEVWALGLRNPWRFSFDRSTADLYIGDVGQAAREEIDWQPVASHGGENYGWSILEGTLCHDPATGCVPPPGYVPPVLEYDHTQGCAVVGGDVYRGMRYAEMQGLYFYGDYCMGKVWGLQVNGENWENTLLITSTYNFSAFGQDEAGEVYILDIGGGTVYRIAPVHNVYLPIVPKNTGVPILVGPPVGVEEEGVGR